MIAAASPTTVHGDDVHSDDVHGDDVHGDAAGVNVDGGRVDAALDAMGEPNRRRLIGLLHRRGEATVNELVAASGLRQPQVSKHLKVLAHAELVTARVDGRFRRYRLEGRGLRAAHDWFASFEDVWQARFDALDHLVSTEHQEEHTT